MRQAILIASIATMFLVSCGGQKQKEVKELTPINVQVASVLGSSGINYISASGKIEAEQSANLSTRMMGYVSRVYVKVGQKVSKGQLLISVNNTALQAKKAQVEASIIQAQSAFKNAKKDYDRFKNLYANQSASQKELDDMTTRYEMAKAGLEAAQQMKNEVNAQFAYAEIKAPFSGMVTNTFIKEGDMANPGMPLVSLEGKGKLQVMATVSESDISTVKKGMKVEVLVKSLNQKIGGVVTEVSLSAKNTGGQYLVKVNLDELNKNILSGMFVNVQFPIENKAEVASHQKTLIPINALVSQGQLKGIYTLGSNNSAILRWLRLGKTVDDKVEVLSGLSPNEQYIVSAQGKLFNGVTVRVGQ